MCLVAKRITTSVYRIARNIFPQITNDPAKSLLSFPKHVRFIYATNGNLFDAFFLIFQAVLKCHFFMETFLGHLEHYLMHYLPGFIYNFIAI